MSSDIVDKIYIVLVALVMSVILLFIGMTIFMGNDGNDGKVKKYDSSRDVHYREMVIDNCQYILHDRGITHKGNCTNQFHIYNKE